MAEKVTGTPVCQAEKLTLAVDALAARSGGGAVVAAQLSRALARRPDVDRVWVVVRQGASLELPTQSERLRIVRISTHPPAELARRVLWEAAQLPALVRRVGAHGVVTLSGMLPRWPGCDVVALPSNTLAFEGGGLGNLVRRRLIKRTAGFARAVIVPTEHMARLVGPLPQLLVREEGVDRDVFTPGPEAGRDVVYVADFHPHKRHDLAIRAWALLPEPRPHLRLVGEPSADWKTYDRTRALAHAVDRRRVTFEGRVPASRVASVLRAARVALMPSENESFSMPIAEAGACGVPTVARDLPVLRETGGASALYVSGDDERDWAKAIHDLLVDDALHARVRHAGLTHAPRFSWDRRADAIAAALRSGRTVA